MTRRESLHVLLDALPEAKLSDAELYLRALREVDAEEAADVAAFLAAREEFRDSGEKAIPWERVKAELGLP